MYVYIFESFSCLIFWVQNLIIPPYCILLMLIKRQDSKHILHYIILENFHNHLFPFITE